MAARVSARALGARRAASAAVSPRPPSPPHPRPFQRARPLSTPPLGTAAGEGAGCWRATAALYRPIARHARGGGGGVRVRGERGRAGVSVVYQQKG